MGQTAIKVRLAGKGKTIQITAAIKGDIWKAMLPPKEAGGPYAVTVTGGFETVTLSDVLFGEVWVASGQSNMLMEPDGANGRTDAADYLQSVIPKSTVRICGTQNYRLMPWTSLTKENMNRYSCVAQTFACRLYEKLKIPVGIVQIAEGNTYAQSWMSEDALRSDPELAVYLDAKSASNSAIHPAGFYGTYVSKVLPMSMRGVIWYQGENNANVADSSVKYGKMMKAMITDWRAKWGQGDFPFLMVQLPKLQTAQSDAWCGVREAQIRMPDVLPAVGTAVTIDTGNINPDHPDLLVHPIDKLQAGIRLSLLAQKMVYALDVMANSPVYRSSLVSGSKIIVTMDTFGSFLKAQNSLNGFEICGADGVYQPANAKITAGNTLEIWSESITAPKAARYAWASNPASVSLYNAEGLPASPFRTDEPF